MHSVSYWASTLRSVEAFCLFTNLRGCRRARCPRSSKRGRRKR